MVILSECNTIYENLIEMSLQFEVFALDGIVQHSGKRQSPAMKRGFLGVSNIPFYFPNTNPG
jgi:hypothetical protein